MDEIWILAYGLFTNVPEFTKSMNQEFSKVPNLRHLWGKEKKFKEREHRRLIRVLKQNKRAKLLQIFANFYAGTLIRVSV